MRTTASPYLLVRSSRTLLSESKLSCTLPTRCLRSFSHSPYRRANTENTPNPSSQTQTLRPNQNDRFNVPRLSPSSVQQSASGGALSSLAASFGDLLDQNRASRNNKRSRLNMDNLSSDGNLLPGEGEQIREPHRFYVHASRHNTHVTVTGPPGCIRIKPGKPDEIFKGGVLISISAGNIGFKKSGRKHYDSAFQVASYVMSRMQEAGVSADIKQLEVYLRGFGAGREAVTKALLGQEGRLLRGKVVKVSDATRLKFGGTRSRKPRRLG